MTKTIQDRHPNFRSKDGSLFLISCFNCNKEHGRENYAPNVASGVCTWCGWSDEIDGIGAVNPENKFSALTKDDEAK